MPVTTVMSTSTALKSRRSATSRRMTPQMIEHRQRGVAQPQERRIGAGFGAAASWRFGPQEPVVHDAYERDRDRRPAQRA